MKTALRYLWFGVGCLGLAVVVLGTIYVCARLRAHGGPLLVLAVAIGFGAAWASTPESREMVAKVVRAMARTGISIKLAAYRARMDYAQLSRQLNNKEPMHFDRYHFGPYQHRFELELAQEFAEPNGGVVVQNEHLARIVQRLSA